MQDLSGGLTLTDLVWFDFDVSNAVKRVQGTRTHNQLNIKYEYNINFGLRDK